MNQKNPARFAKTLLVGASALGLLLPAALAQTTFTGDGDGSTWSDGANWDNGEPALGNDISIGNFFVAYDNLASETEFSSLTLLDGADLYIDPDRDISLRFTDGIFTFGDNQIQSGAGMHVLETPFLTSDGAGTHVISSANLFLSPLGAGETLEVRRTHVGSLAIDSSSGFQIPAGSTLRLNPEALEFSGSEIRVAGTITEVAGSGSGINVEVTGGGRVILESGNDYDGSTQVTDSLSLLTNGAILSGGLFVTNTSGSATGSGEVVVRSTDNGGLNPHNQGILGGTGILAGPVDFEGGIFLPGNVDADIGQIVLGASLSMGSGPIFEGTISSGLLLDLDPAATQVPGLTNDLILLTSAGATVDLIDVNLGVFLKSTPTVGQVFRFIDAPFQSLAGSIVGEFNGLPEGSLIQADFNSQTFGFTIHYGDNFVELTAIPEPAAAGVLLSLSTLLFALRRRR